MKICKIYSNQDDHFHNIEFKDGLNVVIAQITDKTKSKTDTHNLGKTLLISVIDFLLLKGTDKKFFLTKGGFETQIFFAEFLLNTGKYLIIRRGVDNPTKISFRVSTKQLSGYKTDLVWDEENVAFEKAKKWLNEYLAFDVLDSWTYRKPITYFLRTQNDFQDVFKLDKFKGKDKDWKPFLFDLLGFNGEVILQKYELEDEKKELERNIETLRQEADIDLGERDRIQGLLAIRTDDKDKVEKQIDKFNFYENDSNTNRELVEEIDSDIRLLNTRRYALSIEMKNIENSLNADHPSINIESLQDLYREFKIYFPNNLINDYERLLQFNKSITEERNNVLQENLAKAKIEIAQITDKLKSLENDKEALLSYLTEKDSYAKFKEAQKQLAQLEADIIQLQNKLEMIDRTSSLTRGVEDIDRQLKQITKEISALIAEQKHANIRKIFNSIIEQVLYTKALLSIKQNSQGNVEFEANIQNPIDLTITAQAAGTTYKKQLCMAFDLSLLMHYSNKSFYRFAYHDGILEALDDRKKLRFLDVVRDICINYGLQYIFTLIDSDLPTDSNGKVVNFPDSEICLRLHDKDDSGRLFKKVF